MQKCFDCQKAINEMEPSKLARFVEIWLGYDENGCAVKYNDITDIIFLKKCEMMEKLDIYSSQITDLPLGNAVKLRYIRIECCKTLQNINVLEGCNELEDIDINYLNITNIAVFGKLQKLKNLTIYDCRQITDYDVLEECNGLTYLHIQSTNISDISPIANLKNLETLELKSNYQLPEQFQKDIDNKHEILELLDECKQTQQYKDYQKMAQSKQQVTPQPIVLKPTQTLKTLTIEEQVKELQDQLQVEKQQREQDIQSQTTQNQQMNQQMENIQQLMQQQNQQIQQMNQNIQQQMQSMMQQMNTAINNLTNQIQQNQAAQNQTNDQMSTVLQQMKINQASNNQRVNQQIVSIAKKYEDNK